MNEEGAIPSAENESKMKDAIDKLQQVHGLVSDIDALCIGPSYATMAEDFFYCCAQHASKCIRSIRDSVCQNARVPIMRFKLNGISFDLPYASLPASPLKYEDILDPFFIENLGESTQRSLSAVQANMHICQFVPNLENFQLMDRCLKFWASRRGVYSHGISRSGFVWRGLFSPFPYTRNYNHFVRIFLAASDDDELWDWMGWVKSHFRSLIIKLERNFGFCDPNPTEYIDDDIVEPNTIFYWGLLHVNGSADISSIEKEFMEILGNSYEVSSCKLELSIIDSNQLPATVLFACGSGKESKACWRILDYCEWREPV